MTAGKNQRTVWLSLVAGVLFGAYLGPVLLPSRLVSLHGMGASGDFLLSGISIGILFLIYPLFRQSRATRRSPDFLCKLPGERG